MIKVSDNNSNVRFYCIDYAYDEEPKNWKGSMCYPSLNHYYNVFQFFKDHSDAWRFYKDIPIEDIHFYECDYDEAISSYNVDDMVCVDVIHDVWKHQSCTGRYMTWKELADFINNEMPECNRNQNVCMWNCGENSISEGSFCYGVDISPYDSCEQPSEDNPYSLDFNGDIGF